MAHSEALPEPSGIGTGSAHMDGRKYLEEAIRAEPQPAAAPRLPRSEGWIGLSFLDSALHQNHIRRITDLLSLARHGTIERTVELDVTTGLLTAEQMDAGLQYSALRGRQTERERLLWVPIARLPRGSAFPLEVVDEESVQVPRLTQNEISPLLASGLYRLLRSLLQATSTSKEATNKQYEELFASGDEARWLLQASLLSLFRRQSRPTPSSVTRQSRPLSPVAARLISFLKTEDPTLQGTLDTFFALLLMAVEEYLVVVGLPRSRDEHFLRYRAPLKAEEERLRGLLRSIAFQLGPLRRVYRVQYSTALPPTIPSYHIIAHVEPGLNIERMVLRCDTDKNPITQLKTDLESIADRLQSSDPGST